jgi:hypothetical protein
MAKALIIDDDYGREAEPYYLKFPEEPASDKVMLTVEKPQFIPTTSLDTLLSSILTTFKDKKGGMDLVIVTHGNQFGMTMGLTHKHPKVARTDHLITLMGDERLEKKAEKLSLLPDVVEQLIAKMDDVRKVGLGHVAFRGCTIAENIKNLITLKDFLGCTRVSATKLLSTFGPGLAKYPKKKDFEKLWALHEKTGHRFEGKSRVLLVTRPVKNEPLKEWIELWLEKEDGMLEWLQKHFVASTTSAIATAVKNRVPLHYLSAKPPVPPREYGSYIFDDTSP